MGTKQRVGSLAVERLIDILDAEQDGNPVELTAGLLTRRSGRVLSQGDTGGDWEIADTPWNEVDEVRTWSPDPNATEEWGEAFGIRYAATEPLRCGDKERDRDRRRWELDPASADDYGDRTWRRWH